MPTSPTRSTPTSRLVAARFSGGWTPSLQRDVDAAGGPRAWFARQLEPDEAGIPDAWATTTRAWWPALARTPAEQWATTRTPQAFFDALDSYRSWVVARRIGTERHVLEAVCAFWEDHLHVPALAAPHVLHRADYGATVRRLALGRFDDLLVATTTHRAMQVYLGGATSPRNAPNENLGRELLELHTVGRGAHTEDDVKAAARLLTGWRSDDTRSGQAAYDPSGHATGPVTVVGWTHPNAEPDGRAAVEEMLRHLAHHPATARRLARKLAVRFVSDEPPEALVDELAAAYLAAGTDVRPVLRTLVAHPAFAASAGRKVRTPEEDLVATWRVLHLPLDRRPGGADNAGILPWAMTLSGSEPFSWPRPDGRPDTARAWTTPLRMLASFRLHHELANPVWLDATSRRFDPGAWLPRERCTFAELVDNVSLLTTGLPASAAVRRAACLATGLLPGAPVDADHRVLVDERPRLLAAVLDTPAHLTR